MVPLGLRNRLAELILDAFDGAEARRTLAALAAFCGSADGRLGAETVTRLAALGWFETVDGDRVRLLGAHRAHRDALCRRAAAALTVVGRTSPPLDPGTLAGLLARAALLAEAGLYFEVHELLEPAWLRAEGAERVALQALIQVAVAFHHVESGNRQGAISLMAEGLLKLASARSVLPIDTAGWEAGLAAVLGALREGGPWPPPPSWPAPAETARRSS